VFVASSASHELAVVASFQNENFPRREDDWKPGADNIASKFCLAFWATVGEDGLVRKGQRGRSGWLQSILIYLQCQHKHIFNRSYIPVLDLTIPQKLT
jgi:hypothetical protein